MKGVYQHCGEKHLHRHLAEFDFRYNTRVALGYNDLMRAEALAIGIKPDLSKTSWTRSTKCKLSVRQSVSCTGEHDSAKEGIRYDRNKDQRRRNVGDGTGSKE
jgi:hypothetical protein